MDVFKGCEWPTGTTDRYYRELVPKDIEGNLAFRKFIYAWASTPARQEELRIICARDVLFFVNVFGFTYSIKDNANCPCQPFITYPYQDRAILELADYYGKCDVAIPKSRDMGATWICLLVLLHQWHFKDQQQTLLTSEVAALVDSKDEKALFRKMDYWLKHLPTWLCPRREKTLMNLENIDNDSKISGQATVPNIARGARYVAIMLDEAAEMPLASQIAAATSKSTNCRIFNSTPNGRFGTGKEFFDRVRNPATKKIWMHWSEHPLKSVGLYKLRRRVVSAGKADTVKDGDLISDTQANQLRQMHGASFVIGERVRVELDPATYDWKQDYDFQRLKFKDGESPRSVWFDAEMERDPNPKIIAKELNLDFEGSTERLTEGDTMNTIRSVMCREPLFRGEVLPSEESLNRGLEHIRPVWMPGVGYLELWCDLKDGRPPVDSYSIGADISGGTAGVRSSQSVASIVSNTTGEQVGEWRGSHLSPDEFAVRVVTLAKWFHNAFIVPEVNGPPGQRFVNKVVACQYWNMYRRSKSEFEAFASPTSKFGWVNTHGVEPLLRGMLAAIAEGKYTIRSLVVADQIEEYELDNGKLIHKASKFNDSASDKGLLHGDAAVAAGCAWLGCESQNILKPKHGEKKLGPEDPDYIPDEIPYGCVAWRRREAQRDKDRAGARNDAVESVW